MSGIACGLHCDACPAAARCGKKPNFCLRGRCEDCADQERMMAERRRVVEHLGGLDLRWPRPVRHPTLPELPDHLPVLVQAYADPVDVPWVALHGGRVFGVAGRWITKKHRRPLHQVYRLGPDTKIALQLYVEDRGLEGFWVARRRIIAELAGMGFDLVLTPNFSVWVSDMRLYVIWNLVVVGTVARADKGAQNFGNLLKRIAQEVGLGCGRPLFFYGHSYRGHPQSNRRRNVFRLGIAHDHTQVGRSSRRLQRWLVKATVRLSPEGVDRGHDFMYELRDFEGAEVIPIVGFVTPDPVADDHTTGTQIVNRLKKESCSWQQRCEGLCRQGVGMPNSFGSNIRDSRRNAGLLDGGPNVEVVKPIRIANAVGKCRAKRHYPVWTYAGLLQALVAFRAERFSRDVRLLGPKRAAHVKQDRASGTHAESLLSPPPLRPHYVVLNCLVSPARTRCGGTEMRVRRRKAPLRPGWRARAPGRSADSGVLYRAKPPEVPKPRQPLPASTVRNRAGAVCRGLWRRCRRRRYDFVTESHASVTDVDTRSCDQTLDLVLALTTERAAEILLPSHAGIIGLQDPPRRWRSPYEGLL